MARAGEALTRTYARAILFTLLEMNGEKGLSKVEAELQKLTQLTDGEGGSFFESPVFDLEEKFKVLEKFRAKEKIDLTLERLFKLLLSERAVHLFPSIVTDFSDVLREHRNEVEANVKTAFTLPTQEEERIAQALGKATGKKIVMNIEVDPELIGGVVAEVGGTIFDASIKGYLERLQEEFEA